MNHTKARLKPLFLALYIIAGLSGLPGLLNGQDNASGGNSPQKTGSAWIIPIRGDIEPSLVAFVRRETRKALSQGAEFIVFEIDTFGGRVDSALQITSFIMSIKKARTVAWVNNGEGSMGVSWSAGALIALSCADIYMAGGTSMGAAAPVIQGTDGKAEGAGEKTVAAVRSQIAALAERNGHPVSIALAMVDYDVDLWEVSVNGQIRVFTLTELERMEKEGPVKPERISRISPPGKLLSLTGGEAYRYGLSRGIADDKESLLAAIGAENTAGESEPGIADGLITFLSSAPIQALLILLGLVMIFLEIHTPGFGIPGVTAIIAFLLVFGSGALLGRVGSLEIILFLIGIGLLAVEIFLLPGFGVAGISGLALIALSLIFSMQDFVIPRFAWEWGLLGRNTAVVIIGIIAAITGIVIIALLAPRIRVFDRLTLKTRITGTANGPELPQDGAESALIHVKEPDYQSFVGKIGVADTTLRPSGRVEIDGEVYAAEADGSFVEAGRGVRVIRVWGNTLIVRLV